ncbi:MAG: flagellar protein export ATPase FliI [Gammaproteobacteria bacterium]|nr:flagellar protein export ATPase FliI [Gammaproteobacteria bacterium]
MGPYFERLATPPSLVVEGKLTRMVGLTLEAVGCQAAIGDRCRITAQGGHTIEAEVVGFANDALFLMPTGIPRGLAPNARVVPMGQAGEVPVGDALLGRVIDGSGKPLDGAGPLRTDGHMPLHSEPINPLKRKPISVPLDVGVRSINALLTVGCGQRLGLFAPAGVGKSVLLGMMTRFTNADVIVVGLVGERGREVKEFIEHTLGADGLRRAVVVATPADTPPLLRLHGAAVATAVAEYFRNRGKHVLLLMDSLTRYAQASREIALTIGEPPATRGYPPSVFARLPQLVERAGPGAEGPGSITAIYTVLTDGEDMNDPVAEAARAILDGHIVLSRRLAESGQLPAIDIEASVSRAMNQITQRAHQERARQFRRWYSLYGHNRDLLAVGAYQAGTNVELDRAVRAMPLLTEFLRQDMHAKVTMEQSLRDLGALVEHCAGDETRN